MERKTTHTGVKGKKVAAFVKKNIYYFIMVLCLAAIAVMVTLTVINKNKANDIPTVDAPIVDEIPADNTNPGETPIVTPPVDDTPIVAEPIVFGLPVYAENVNVIKDYTMDTLVFSTTLKQFQVHNGIDYSGNEGDSVFAAYGGIVKSVGYDVLNGYTVTIEHGEGLVSSYSSLKETKVSEGQGVAKGELIGTIGVTATSEMSDGPHLHFSVLSNGAYIDPNSLFADDTK